MFCSKTVIALSPKRQVPRSQADALSGSPSFAAVTGNQSVSDFYEKNGYIVFKANQAFKKEWKQVEEAQLGPDQTFDQLVQRLFSPCNSEEMLEAEGIEYQIFTPALERGRRFIPNAATVKTYKPFNQLISKGIDAAIRDLSVTETSLQDDKDLSYRLKRSEKTQLIISDVHAKDQAAHCDANDLQHRMFWIINTVGNHGLDVWPGSHIVLRDIRTIPEETFDPKKYRVIPRVHLLMEELSVVFISGGLLHRGPKNELGKLHVRGFGELDMLSSQGEQIEQLKATEEQTHILLKRFRRLFTDT